MTGHLALVRTVGLAGLLASAFPLIGSAQDLRPCAPVVAGGPCVHTPAGPWANLDFGRHEQIADVSAGWQAENVPFRVMFPHPGTEVHRMLYTPIVPPASFDCAMTKPGDPALDPKMVIKPHVTHSGQSQPGVVTVAPCKAK